ncbi:MAG: hypothetical protein HOF15_02095, partial [Planctomycetaceae bacterium]|nr:hypothetical protein [Planctomycetaceae bacterium]
MKICHNHRSCLPFSWRGIVVWSAFLLIGMCDAASVFSDEPSPKTLVDDGHLEQRVEDAFPIQTTLFLKKYCVKCHGAKTQEGDLRLDTVLHDLTDDKTAKLWNDVFAQVQFSEMPPSDSEQQPSAATKARFLNRVETELMRFGRGFDLREKMLLPQFGNYVDHQTLFNGTVTEAPYTPARLWRQRPIIYDAIWKNAYGRAPWYSIKIGGTGSHLIEHGPHKGKLLAHRYFADAKYANPFFEFVHHASGFTDYASIVADQSSLEALMVNAETMAEILTLGQKV